MAKAKTASKNNPVERESAKVIMYNNQKIKPVKVIMAGRKYMAAQYESGQLVLDKAGQPIAWRSIRS